MVYAAVMHPPVLGGKVKSYDDKETLKVKGVRQVVAVIADTGDGASVALHRSSGFADVGRLTGVGRKHGRWVDTVLMQCDLITGRPDHRRFG